MKKYLFGIVAMLFAVGTVAFTTSSKDFSLHWYKRTAPDTYVADGVGADPIVICDGIGTICAKGFISPQTEGDIRDNTTAAQTREKD